MPRWGTPERLFENRTRACTGHIKGPRGTKTWQLDDLESTIDLVLGWAELADQLLRCRIHPCDHGSDHRAIETAFDIAVEDGHLDGNQDQGSNRSRAYPLGRQRSAAGRYAYDSSNRGGLQPDTSSQALSICQAVVDNRLDTAPSDIHILEEPGEVSTEDGTDNTRARPTRQDCSQGIP